MARAKKKSSKKKTTKKRSSKKKTTKKRSSKKKTTKKKKPPATKTTEQPTEEVKEEAPAEKSADTKEAPAVEVETKAKTAPKKKKSAPKKADEEYETIEFEDVFDKDRAYAHIKELAIPRLVGSEGEKKAAEYIKKKFKGLNLETNEEEFEFTDFAWDVIIRLMEGIKAGLIVIALVLILLPSPATLIGVFLSVATLFITFYSSIWARFFWKYQNSEGKIIKANKFNSRNIIAKLPCKAGPKDASGDIIIMANYDSKSQTWSALWRILFFYLALLISVAFPAVYIGNYILTQLGISSSLFLPLVILVGISVVSTVLLELNTTGNNSPGAINNASGVGTLLELAQICTTNPLENHNITFIATGAGEMGLFGAISFLKAHESEFSPEDTFFINLKDIAGRGHFYIPGPIGFPPRIPCLEVENLFKKALKRRKIPVEEGSNMPIRVLSPWVFTGAWNDDMVAVLRGFNANRVGIGGHIRKRQIIHTAKDTLEQIDIEAIDLVGKVTDEVLRRLDIRARP